MKKFYVGVKGIVRDKTQGILLLHRDYKSGDYWDIPGGRIDAGENFNETLIRELGEELPGISDIEVGALMGAYRLLNDIDGDVSLVLLYFLVNAKLPHPIVLSEEHESFTWVKTKKSIPKGLNPEIEAILIRLLK